MPKYCYTVYPASGVKSGMDNILYSVSNFVVGKFPQRTIRAKFIDTRDKMRDFYKNALSVYAGKTDMTGENVQEIIKIPRPHLYVGYDLDSSFDTMETGLGETQPYMYPNAYFIQEHLGNALPILIDKERNISMYTNNLRIKTVAEFLFSCQNKEEQITLYVYIKNFLKDMYSHVIEDITTNFTMPNFLINNLKEIMYGKQRSYDDIGQDFDTYLASVSDNGIVPVYRNNKETDKFYELKYKYNRIDFKITGKPQLDSGDKKDAAYDNYTIRFPIVIEYYVPIGYIMRTPELIPGVVCGVSEIKDYMAIDNVSDEDENIQVLPVVKSYKDTLIKRDKNGLRLVKREEFALADKNDYYDVRWLMDEKDLKIFESLTDSQKKECYSVELYEDDYILDTPKYCKLNDNWIVDIFDGDTNKLQTIELYIDFEKIINYIKQNGVLK